MYECKEWTGYRDKDGYGRMYYKGTQVVVSRRVMAALLNVPYHSLIGVVRHICDNTACYNPAHLIIGSQQDNMTDMVSRGRLGKRLGELNNQAVLSDEDVSKLRAEYTPGWGELSRLGRKYGVSRVTVKNIVSMRYRNG